MSKREEHFISIMQLIFYSFNGRHIGYFHFQVEQCYLRIELLYQKF